MKTHRIELWALLFVFVFFPAAAQAQVGDIPGPKGAGIVGQALEKP